MTDIQINVTIQAPELVEAIKSLAAAMGTSKPAPAAPTQTSPQAPATYAPSSVPPVMSFPTQQQAPVNPQNPAPMQSNPMMGAGNMAPFAGPVPSQPAPTAPSINPAPVPTAAAPAYDLSALSYAASPLMAQGKQQELVALLGNFGVQALNQLPPERYGEFATALRGLGAKI